MDIESTLKKVSEYDQGSPQSLQKNLLCLEEIQKVKTCKQVRGYKTFFMFTSTEHKISTAHKNYNVEKDRYF